jgi:NRAMP (natural resistance-associated macrophage protein)-like metal ion transporter
MSVLGPGVITGAAGDDPAGIGTYAQAGARSGTGLLWLLLLATPMLQVVQVTCAKLGMAQKKGLSAILMEQYGIRIAAAAALLTAVANLATLGADIAGVAAGFELVFHVRWQWFVVPVTLAIWYCQVFLDYRRIRAVLLAMALALIAYIVAGFMARPNWGAVLRATFVPTIDWNPAFFGTAVGLLGTTISPYMFYSQCSGVVEERTQPRKIHDVVLDTTAGTIFTNLVAYFIVVSTATTLFKSGRTIESAHDAARALEPFAGSASTIVFAVGIIGAGLLAVPVLAAATASMIGETLGWRVGLNKSANRAPGFYLALSVALGIGVLITLAGIDPIKALFYSQIVNGIVAPILLVMIFRMARRNDVLGEFVNSAVQQFWGWLTIAVMAISALLMAQSWLGNGGQ